MIKNRKINLAKLLEALELDDEITKDPDAGVFKLTSNAKATDIFTNIVEGRFLKENTSPLNPLEQNIIDDMKANPEKYYNKIPVTNIQTLKLIFKNAVPYLGDTGDYNWIDTSSITSLCGLFKDKRTFNGDITKWNTGNVTNMLSTFEGCSSFNRDLSGWNVEKVAYINSVTFKGCQESLVKCFKAKKYPNNKLRFT